VSDNSNQQLLDEAWLQSLYRECGRELSLAYTTLNQLTNWAIVVVGALFSTVALGSTSSTFPRSSMVAGVAVAYTFILRFFIRAILAYINVTRWNTLQSSCVRLKLLRDAGSTDEPGTEAALAEKIRNYYVNWLSPISRKTQLLSSLRLGFALFFALPLLFLVWGTIKLWTDSLVRGVATFVIGITAVEMFDFTRSRFFDDVEAYKARTIKKQAPAFPSPAADIGYMVAWCVVVLLSTAVAFWPKLF
jgi:hypothetical protein